MGNFGQPDPWTAAERLDADGSLGGRGENPSATPHRSWPETPESAHHLCGASRISALRSSILLEHGRAKVNEQPPPRRPGRR